MPRGNITVVHILNETVVSRKNFYQHFNNHENQQSLFSQINIRVVNTDQLPQRNALLRGERTPESKCSIVV